MTEELQLRCHGNPDHPTLVYLPGLHGDWTLVGRFRDALAGRLHWIEITYPRTLTWSLEDYAAHLEQALLARKITQGWLLAESFSSQVAWPLASRKIFRTQGVILAGGFVRHPIGPAVRIAELLAGGIPLKWIVAVLFGYAKIARYRYARSPETVSALQEFLARRTELDRQAATHRLRLIAENDPSPIARNLTVPIFAITGLLDPVVPWFIVRSWLRRHCPALRDYRIIRTADHNVLGTGARQAADQVVAWIRSESAAPRRPGLPD